MATDAAMAHAESNPAVSMSAPAYSQLGRLSDELERDSASFDVDEEAPLRLADDRHACSLSLALSLCPHLWLCSCLSAFLHLLPLCLSVSLSASLPSRLSVSLARWLMTGTPAAAACIAATSAVPQSSPRKRGVSHGSAAWGDGTLSAMCRINTGSCLYPTTRTRGACARVCVRVCVCVRACRRACACARARVWRCSLPRAILHTKLMARRCAQAAG